MASGHTRGQKPSPFGLAPICFGSRTGAEHQKQPLPKALSALVLGQNQFHGAYIKQDIK